MNGKPVTTKANTNTFFFKPLADIIDKCISKSISNTFKKADIVPIYGASDKFITTNYWKIALISNFAEIFEKVLHTSNEFSNNYKIFSCNQFVSFGRYMYYRSFISDSDALALISDF